MKIIYTLHGICFEWENEKAIANMGKHGVSFETACEIFFDPFVKTAEVQEVEGEVREVIVGMTTRWQILCVVHTVREEEHIRLISARKADPTQRRKYENQ